jgi:hypothetical protein
MQTGSATHAAGAPSAATTPITLVEKLRHAAKSLTVEVVVLERVSSPRQGHEPTEFLAADGEWPVSDNQRARLPCTCTSIPILGHALTYQHQHVVVVVGGGVVVVFFLATQALLH